MEKIKEQLVTLIFLFFLQQHIGVIKQIPFINHSSKQINDKELKKINGRIETEYLFR